MSDHPEMIEQIKKMFDEKYAVEGQAASNSNESLNKFDNTIDDFTDKVIDIHDVSARRANAVRAIGFLEGFGALLWTQVGPNLADKEVAEFEKRVADIAAYIGLPPREVDAKMSRPESPKVTRAKELIKDKRLSNKQIALRCGTSSSYVGYLRRQMEANK